jgi:hypothetical protein
MIFLPEAREAYKAERALIEHDIQLFLTKHLGGAEILAIMLIMLSNRVIWESESKARTASGVDQDKLLKFTHSINGIRNRAKNVIAEWAGDRKDLKIDCLAADLPPEFGNWNIFDD